MLRAAATGALALCSASPAWGHAGERGFVLLLPTRYWIVGGTLAVAASFAVLLLVPAGLVRRAAAARIALFPIPPVSSTAISAASFLLLFMLLITGLSGSRDPLSNPLPLTVWGLWWTGLTIAQALFGNLWAALNPWLAPYRLLRRLVGEGPPPLAYPDRLGYWPAVIGLLGFAWFELIDPAPDDPARLAVAAAIYSAATLVGMVLFGERAWLSRAECFSVFFGFVAGLSPFRLDGGDSRSRRGMVTLGFPGAGLAERGPLHWSGVLLVLLGLGTVSFDGLSKTFWWLDLGGINPLEFPGRSAVVGLNALGLVATWTTLAAAYAVAVALGAALIGRRDRFGKLLGLFVLSILPISIAYHFAHYLTAFMLDAQYAARAYGDPFALGWNLLGLADAHVTVSFLSSYDSVSLIWKLQAGAVIAGHILAVLLAHLIAVEHLAPRRAAMLSQLPLTLLMIGYTLFGLWLLAAPTAG